MAEKINDRLEWETYKETRIVCADCREMTTEDLVPQIRQNNKDLLQIGKKQGKASLLFYIDLTNAVISNEVMAAAKEDLAELQPYLKAVAVAGITGVRRFLTDVVRKFTGNNMRGFPTEVEAKDWLVKEARK